MQTPQSFHLRVDRSVPQAMPPLMLMRSLVLALSLLGAVPALVPLAWAQASGARPAAAATPLAQCAAVNREALAELTQVLKEQEAANRVNPLVMARLQPVLSDAAALRVRALREVRTFRECDALSEAIAGVNERLGRIVGANPEVADCVAANSQALRDAVQTTEAEVQGAPPPRAAAARELLARLNELRPGVVREGQTLAGCRQLGLNIAQLRTRLEGGTAVAESGAEAGDVNTCRAANVDSYAEALFTWRAAASARRLRPGQPEYDTAMARLRELRDRVARQGFSMRECEALAQALAQEGARAEGGPGQGGTPVGGDLPVGAVGAPGAGASPAVPATPVQPAPGGAPLRPPAPAG